MHRSLYALALLSLALLSLALLSLASCKSQPCQGSQVILLPKDKERIREAMKEKDPKKHQHTWEEWSWHTAEDWSSGIPMTKIVTVYRCPECGEIRDESQRRKK